MADAGTNLLISPSDKVRAPGGWINKPPPPEDQRVRVGRPDERMMEAILLLCGEGGYADTSVQAVIGRAGVSRNTFYKNFADNEDCFLRAYEAGVDEFTHRILAPGREAQDWRSGVRAALTALVEVLEEQPMIASCLIVEAHTVGRRTLEKRASAMRQFALALDRIRRTSAEAAVLPPLTSEIVVGGLESLVRRQIETGDPATPRLLLPELVYFAVRPYLGHRVATEEASLVRASAPSAEGPES